MDQKKIVGGEMVQQTALVPYTPIQSRAAITIRAGTMADLPFIGRPECAG